jgi:hypothetical protein
MSRIFPEFFFDHFINPRVYRNILSDVPKSWDYNRNDYDPWTEPRPPHLLHKISFWIIKGKGTIGDFLHFINNKSIVLANGYGYRHKLALCFAWLIGHYKDYYSSNIWWKMSSLVRLTFTLQQIIIASQLLLYLINITYGNEVSNGVVNNSMQ